MADQLRCTRCGETKPGLDAPPLPGEPGRLVHRGTCRDCWQAWLRAQVILINEQRLSLADEAHYDRLVEEMKSYLGLRSEDER